MTAQVESVLMPQRLGSLLLTIFGGLTLLLAGVGIYGVVGYNILRQARELGIRIAVGASSATIVRTVVVGMTGPVVLGLAAGLVAVVLLGRTVTGFLYQVGPADPASLAVAAGALLLVALVAVLIPAWRATRIDPAKVLMAE
jgi:ABC-type antimicrobial peptide transport system permease subunit